MPTLVLCLTGSSSSNSYLSRDIGFCFAFLPLFSAFVVQQAMAAAVCFKLDDSSLVCFVEKMISEKVPKIAGKNIVLATDTCAYYQAVGSPHALPLTASISDTESALKMAKKLEYLAKAVRGSPHAFDGSQFIYVGDLLALEDNGWIDKNTLDALRSGITVPVTQSIKTLLRPDHLGTISPLVDSAGLDSLQDFYDVVLKPVPFVKTWADVIMIAIIMYTSVYWEERLARLYPRTGLRVAVEALAEFAMDAYPVADHNVKAFDPDPLLIYSSLRILRHMGYLNRK